MLFVLMGLTPGTDVLAHLGGFVSGLLIGILLGCLPSGSDKPSRQVFSSVGFAVMVVLPWWLALRKG